MALLSRSGFIRTGFLSNEMSTQIKVIIERLPYDVLLRSDTKLTNLQAHGTGAGDANAGDYGGGASGPGGSPVSIGRSPPDVLCPPRS